jgi:biotin transport system substrate-specific component
VTVRLQSHTLSWAREDLVRSLTLRRTIGVSVFAMATAFAARLAIPLPGTPVPFTLQVLCVILAGATLGPRLGAASQLAYLAVGALGAPIFAAGGGPAYLLGPTGGYLLAFPVAAYAVGAIAGHSLGVLRLALGLAVGVVLIHAGGTAWLALLTGSLMLALKFGVGSFLLLDLVKIGLAVLMTFRLRSRALELF